MKADTIIEPNFTHAKHSNILSEHYKGEGIISFEEKTVLEIKEALAKYAKIDSENVNVEIRKHSVHLSGIVDSKEQKNDAETIAWICLPDAVDVVNELKIDKEADDEIFEF